MSETTTVRESEGEAKPTFPPVVLNTTLKDLLFSEQPADEPLETLCLLKPNSDHQYGEAVPLSNKYIIHSAQVANGNDLAHLQLENCSHLLMFFAGAMDVMFLGCDGKTDDETLSRDAIDRNAKLSFGVIQESQRPKITTYANEEDCIKNFSGSKIRYGFAMDFAEKLPHVFHPEHIYLLNSKRWLALCDLKSANDRILECAIECVHHSTKDGLWYFGGKSCETCTKGIEEEIRRICRVLESRPTPYVLKLTQSLSAVGTDLVRSPDEQEEVSEKIAGYLRAYLPRITKDNAHLHTTALILSDFVPGETMALNFYVRRNGDAIFLGACHQLSTGESGRQATAITYANQERLEMKYRQILETMAQTLHAEGYWGPVGADVMEDPETGTLFAIDLNVRVPLSLLLFLLRTHFNDTHGLGMSLVYECVMLKISREELEKRFAKEFSEARIVLLGSTRLGKKEVWAYGMVIAGEDKSKIDDLSTRILEFEAKDQQVDG